MILDINCKYNNCKVILKYETLLGLYMFVQLLLWHLPLAVMVIVWHWLHKLDIFTFMMLIRMDTPIRSPER